MKVKRAITLLQRPGGMDLYRVEQVKNTTDYNIGQSMKKDEVEKIIRSGIEVVIKGGK